MNDLTIGEILWNLRFEFAHAELTPEKANEYRNILEKIDQELCELRNEKFLLATQRSLFINQCQKEKTNESAL